ncbi:DUF4998 domain-containing protein [Mucilaginibacter endophyticus]|uniref:DUF4998 domain-containing protein n=1 Tax=Mucilaginibacter endophyticus TaxID=2675003 RepID=UPI000E0D350A|nr:DUF4998 domain-containing protein [Mucilaginibacter endophyticus]
MKKILSYCLLLFLFQGLAGCKKYATDYKNFLNNQEKTYPGLVSGVKYRAGNLRAALVWHPSPDPSIIKYVIKWNNGKDSLVADANSHNPADSIVVTIPGLNEYVYSFKIITQDNKGNRSIGQDLNNVKVFGPVYMSTLTNRLYDAANPYVLNTDGSVDLNFLPADSGNVYTNVNYVNNADIPHTYVLKPQETTLNLPDFKYGSSISYESGYIPVKGAIDTFRVERNTYPEVKLIGDITNLFIKNAGHPFQRKDSGTGKWGLLKDWSYNSDVIDKLGNTAGGYSTDDGGNIHIESSDDGNRPVRNGKIWQSFSLPSGEYEVEYETGPVGGNTRVNELVVTGTSLPDIDNLGTPLAIFQGNQNTIGGYHTIKFKLTQKTTIAVGWVVFVDSSTYLEFRGIKLRKVS